MPQAGQAVVEVQHASLNHGDLNDAVSGRVPGGQVLILGRRVLITGAGGGVGAFAVQLAAAGAKSGSGGEAALQSGIK